MKCGFFNSVNGDRVYYADDFNSTLEAIASEGIFRNKGGALQVIVNTGLSVQVLTGYCRFNKIWAENEVFENLDIALPSTQYARIDAVVVRVDNEARTAVIDVLTGVPAAEPAAPEMIRTDSVNEYCLAYITVPANATQIQQSNITDTRGDASVCGWVKCGALVRYNSVKTITTSTTTMKIEIPEYENGDIVDIYRGGIYMIDGVDYTILNDTITFTSAISSGAICIVVTKQVF